MISGFQATMAVDDSGTGAAPGGASTVFTGLVTLSLPDLEAMGFDATELNQLDTGVADPYERELPTGTIKIGKIEGELKYIKDNYTRCKALLGVRDHVFIVTTPDDLTTPGTPRKLAATLVGWFSKLGKVVFEKGKAVAIPFEITVQKKPTSYA